MDLNFSFVLLVSEHYWHGPYKYFHAIFVIHHILLMIGFSFPKIPHGLMADMSYSVRLLMVLMLLTKLKQLEVKVEQPLQR